MNSFVRRDVLGNDSIYGAPTFIFMTLILLACCSVASLVVIRRHRRAAIRVPPLPLHNRHGHQRTLTIATTPSSSRGEAIFVYDEKMNLIANSHGPPNSAVPEIHVTFPDEEDTSGQRRAGRVVVLRVSDSGSVGMEPLHQEPLPPYQRTDAGQFQTLDLERIGGLREKPQSATPRYS